MKKIDFSKKLAAYSAMAVAGVTAASGQVVYTDVSPDSTFTFGDGMYVDIDGDGTDDFIIGMGFSSWTSSGYQIDNGYIFMAPLVGGNSQMGTAGWASNIWYGSALNLNDPINSAQNWVAGAVSNSYQLFASTFYYSPLSNPSSVGGGLYGNFPDGTDHYLGFRFKISGATHYGWMRVNVASDMSNMVLKDWAYEATADAQILAGQTVTSIEQNVINEAKIFSYDKQITINLSEQVEGIVRVYNAIGQEVYSGQISDVNMVIDMPGAQVGIYTVVIESNNYVTQKKVSL